MRTVSSFSAHIFGAGHIITFSGTLYKFYQLGDFWLLNHADFKMQGRTVSNKRSSNSNEPGVALWQSVAMKCGNSDVVRVTGIPYKTMAFFVNDIPRKYTGSTQVHKGVHISFCSDGYTIHFKKDSKDYIVNVNVVNKDESSTLVITLQWPGKIDEVNGLLALTTAPDANTEAFTAGLAKSNYVENSRVSMLEQYVDENAYSIERARNMAFPTFVFGRHGYVC
ncbi:hypothetical protein LSAT2_016880 [Lamellibrachia satsuma]|nr:hypothetical protein LSAT2_016880 [Lamellibrachia satsuma]